jgi:hypothetical protein
MWASIRRYENNPKLAEALSEHSEEIIALTADVDGFVSYYLLRSGTDTVSVTIANDKSGVEESNEIAKKFLAEHAADVPYYPPEITEGEVLITTST